MLKIYYADALTDREKFIFDRIDPAKKTILLVPDQFSLQAEQDALQYCGSALLDLMVTDFSALGHKVVKETEGHEPEIIDIYGRHMLLSVLIEALDEELTVFRSRRGRGAGSKGNSGLAAQMNTMISEMKRYEIGPDKLEETIGRLKEEMGLPAQADPSAEETGVPTEQVKSRPAEESAAPARIPAAGSYLVLKLEDTLRIYRAYEEAIDGVYQDAEDYITYYADRIPRSALVQDSDVWIYGFDTFTPKNLLVIRRLLETADSVSVVMTWEEDPKEDDRTAALRSLTRGGGAGLFRLTEEVMQRLEQTAEEAGREHRREKICGYERQSIWTDAAESGEHEIKAAASAAEHAVGSPEDAPVLQDQIQDRICLVQTSGTYEEAERAAAFIQSLVRDEGYRYGEIAVLCNDMDHRGRQLLRAFERWDIPAFADQKRKVLHQPVVSFLLSFLEVLTKGQSEDGVMGMVKSGLLGWSTEDEALLENYVKEFRIRGSRWQKPFTWDGGIYTEEDLVQLNAMRAFLMKTCDTAKDAIGRRNTAEEKVRGLIRFLQEDFRILERIEQSVEQQQTLQLMEGAAETAQIWNAVCGVFDQIIRVIGGQRISNGMLRDMISAGLEVLEIGLVPASSDCVLMGTLQRSRPGKIRALVVTGANAGLLPMDLTDDGLLSRREKERLESMDLEFAGRERVARMEEQVAIYRMFSLPSSMLYVSCSKSGDDGSMLRPSELFRQLQRWHPEIAGDLSEGPLVEQIGSRRAAVPYLARALRESEAKVKEDAAWAQVLQWYEENDPRQAARLLRGVQFDNRTEALGEELADALYRGDREALEASASRLEKYSGCPFAHFIQYGLRAQEQRLFEVGGREIGDVYHRCMMEFSRSLEAASAAEAGNGGDGAPGSSDAPTWQTITEEQCRAQIAQILQGSAADYREGLFASDGDNRFRMERIAEICSDIAWAMVKQVRQGRIRRMYFEEPFRGGARLPAVEVKIGDKVVCIRGIIDRLDVMDAGPDQPEAIRIVDYKTGSNTVRAEDFRTGYKLQLMVYMGAALQTEHHPMQPAGVFYFRIRDFNIDGDQSAGVPDPADPSDLQRRMQKYYRMEGIMVNDAALIGAMDEQVDGTDKAESGVIPVKYDPKKECYKPTGGGTLLEKEEFRQLLEETSQQAERICGEIFRGEIAAAPKRETKKDRDGNRITACRFCSFQSICGFDPALKGCRYTDV